MNVSMNTLVELPSLRLLSKLTVLDASHNNLTDFPDGLDESGALQVAELNLSSNRITEILPAVCIRNIE